MLFPGLGVCNGYSGQPEKKRVWVRKWASRIVLVFLFSFFLTPSAADPEFIGQMLLTMVDEDGAPFDV
ncbi:hypothetical protein ACLBOM_20875 [Escherichia coli]